MNKTHFRIGLTVDVELLKAQLESKSNLFDKFNMRRTAPGSPHREMTDIWIRANAVIPTEDYTAITKEHDSVWYPAYHELPACRQIIFDVMAAVDGERLGDVLITKLPPGQVIYPHRDAGWHAEYYDKFYVPIKNAPGAIFGFEDGVIDPIEGDVYYFENDKLHWVRNPTDTERLAMIICIRRTK